MRRTQQEPVDIHEIWEPQLAELLKMRRDGLSDAMSIAIGAGVALIPTCLESIVGYFDTPSAPLTVLHLAEIGMFFLSIGVAGTLRIVIKRRKREGDDLATIIRGQAAE